VQIKSSRETKKIVSTLKYQKKYIKIQIYLKKQKNDDMMIDDRQLLYRTTIYFLHNIVFLWKQTGA
jgi:hypothetical protein